MNARELLNHLRELDVVITAEGGKLRINAPAGVLTAELRNALAAHKQALLSLVATTAPPEAAAPGTIPPADRSAPLPLSVAQERLWFLEQLAPGMAAHAINFAFRLRGALHRTALQESLQALVTRHEALRTTVQTVDGMAVQHVAAEMSADLPVVDLSATPPDRRKATLRARLRAWASLPFDPAGGPLFRFILLRLTAQEHVFGVSMHHLISDGWSFDIFFRELSVLYAGQLRGEDAALPPLPRQYADFAVHQRQELNGNALAPHIDFWKQTLAGDLPALDLPLDFPRPAQHTYRGRTFHFSLPANIKDRVGEFARENRLTPFTVLLAVFAALLHRYTRQNDLTIGTPIAHRDRPEIEDVIGCFVNTLVLRCRLHRGMNFQELLAQLRQVTRDAYTHADVPFEKIVEVLQPRRDLSRNPLFQVMFQTFSPGAPRLSGLQVEPLELEASGSELDLHMLISDAPDGYEGRIIYCPDLFTAATIERLAGHYCTLLAALLATPDTPLAEVAMLTPAERRQILLEWNDTTREFPHQPVHRLFERQAARRPQSVAVRFGEAHLTFAELDARANRMAHLLKSQRVQPGTLVGVCLPRSPDLPAVLLGILKAGAAYLPLDPGFPARRLQFMLQDSGATQVISTTALTTRPELADAFPAETGLLCLDEVQPRLAQQPDTPPEITPDPERTAYVIYTSGSTGNPKGVEITHRNVVNFLTAMAEAPGITAQDTLLAVTTLSFDISVLEIFLPLLNGATVALVPQQVAADGRELAAAIAAHRPTLMQATPATWRMLLDSGWQPAPGFKVLCGGEALPPDLCKQLLAHGVELWNLYGPTETTVWSLTCRVRDARRIAIGRPIANTIACILDEALQPVPVGVAGELFLGGEGLARGYHNRPKLTRERFIDRGLPPEITPRAPRLYRTGDLARWSPDHPGQIEYLGRMDDQMKLRGFRIEPGEIESALGELPFVAQAVVAAKELKPGDQRLIAYVVPAGEASFRPRVARKHLRSRLPDYMIPSFFVTLPALPLTPNGKVDRKQLPLPSRQSDPDQERRFAPPQTALQKQLAAIWQELLGGAPVGLNDNFFDIGGHSLLSLQMIARVESALGVRLTPREVLVQNLGQIARLCQERRTQQPAQSAEKRGWVQRIKSTFSG